MSPWTVPYTTWLVDHLVWATVIWVCLVSPLLLLGLWKWERREEGEEERNR